MKNLIYLLALLVSAPVYADLISGKVVRVVDGDTLTILSPSDKQVRARLAKIDAQEKAPALRREVKAVSIRPVAGQKPSSAVGISAGETS